MEHQTRVIEPLHPLPKWVTDLEVWVWSDASVGVPSALRSTLQLGNGKGGS